MGSDAKLALTEVGTNEVEIMCFYLDLKAGEDVLRSYYGVNVAKVLKIMPMPEQVMRPPESSHQAVWGAFHFKDRDKVVPLIGLARYLEEERVPSAAQKIIITEFNQVTTAFIVSGITRIYRLNWEDVAKPGRLVNEYSGNAFTGVVKLEGDVVFILDLEKIVLELNPDSAEAFFGLELDDVGEQGSVNILHVDDQVVVRRLVKKALEQDSRFSVMSAESGRDALDRLEQMLGDCRERNVPLTDVVDVIVSDVEMPVMDGYTLCRNVKDNPDLRDVPFFLFSSLITEETLHKGESVKADGQFPKPQTEAMAKEIMGELAKRCIGE